MSLIPGALYRGLLRPILFGLDAETAHHLALSMLSIMPPLPIAGDPPELRSSLWGLEFSNPIGLAAGMDKDAIAIEAWQSLGFGFAELGTITPRPQPGSPKPRVFRIPEHRALINRLGFPSEGMDVVAPRIDKVRRGETRIRIALNFGPNKDTPVEKVAADYAALMTRMASLADFVVINVSSPNTPGLRNWQSPERMRELFAAMEQVPADSRRPPILLKVAPDLDDATLDALCDTAMALHLDGMVVCNTTLKRGEVGGELAAGGAGLVGVRCATSRAIASRVSIGARRASFQSSAWAASPVRVTRSDIFKGGCEFGRALHRAGFTRGRV